MAVLSLKRSQATRQLPRREKAKPSLVWKKSWNLLLFLGLCLLAGFQVARTEQVFPVSHFEVYGELQFQQRAPIETLLRRFEGEGFFALPIHELKFELLQLPWVEQASVQRMWPDTLRVHITEKTPLARWDENHLMSTRGNVFKADAGLFEELPLIYATTHSPQWAMQQFFELQAAFDSVDETLVALHIDGRAAFELELATGLVIKLGRDQIDKKVSRLISIYAREIAPRKARIEQLDLRYSNGFAVTWKTDESSEDKASFWSKGNV